MSSARIGVPPASVIMWSAAHWFTRQWSRWLQVSNTQQPPAPAADEGERAPEFEVLALGQPAVRARISDAAAFLAAPGSPQGR